MKKRTLKIKYTDAHAQALNLTPVKFEAEMCLVVRLPSFASGGFSQPAPRPSSRGVPTPVFLGGMAEFGILAFDPTPEEFEKEVETVLQHSRKGQGTKR